jgi:hypothetical protein
MVEIPCWGADCTGRHGSFDCASHRLRQWLASLKMTCGSRRGLKPRPFKAILLPGLGLFQPVNFDFFFERLEFRVAGYEFGLCFFCQGGGEGVG